MQVSIDFKKPESTEPLAAPKDLATTYRGLTAKAFVVPPDVTTDAKFAEARKTFLQALYRVEEAKWSYAVPSFAPGAQATDPYLQQMKLLIAEFSRLAAQMNEILRQEMEELVKVHPDAAIRQLAVPSLEELIQFHEDAGTRLPSTLEQQLPALAPILEQVKRQLDLAVNTSLYQSFADRFGRKEEFIKDGPNAARDREAFYRSNKMKLEVILQIFRQQYEECHAPSMTPDHRTGTVGTIRDFLRELQEQALQCPDGMAFISDAYDSVTRGNTPEHWLSEWRKAIAYAIVPGVKLITGDDGFQIHAQTAVERVATTRGLGISSCLPYSDQYKDNPEIKNAMAYADSRLSKEFPYNYNYETVCHYIAEKLCALAREAVQEFKGQVIQPGQPYQDMRNALTIKLRNPPFSFTGLQIDQIIVHSAAEGVYRINELLFDTKNHFSHFINRAMQLLADRGLIQPNSALWPSPDSPSSSSSSSFARDEVDMRLSAALEEAVGQRRMHELHILLLHPDATKAVTPDLIRRALDDKQDQRALLPRTRREEAPYQRQNTWERQIVLWGLLGKLPDSAFEVKKVSDHLLVIALEHAQYNEFGLIMDFVVERLAPTMGSALCLNKGGSIQTADYFKAEQCRSLQHCGEQLKLLHQGTERLRAYANLPLTSTPMGKGEGLHTSFLTEFVLSPTMSPLLMKKIERLWHIPYLEFPFTHWQPTNDLYKTLSQVIASLRAQRNGEPPDPHRNFSQDFVQNFIRCFVAAGRPIHIMKIIYSQCGENALPFLQDYCTPPRSQEEAKSKEIHVSHLLEYSRYWPVNLSIPRWLECGASAAPRLENITPLRAALRYGGPQQFSQLLAAGADPTVDPQDPTLLITLAASTHPDIVFIQLVNRTLQVCEDKDPDAKKARDYAHRRSAAGDTALSVLVQQKQLRKLAVLLTHLKNLDIPLLPESAESNPCRDWIHLVVAIREENYAKAMHLFLLFLGMRSDDSAQQDSSSPEIKARWLCKLVQQQGGENATPFLTYLAQQTDEVDLLLVMSECTPEAKVNFNDLRPGSKELLLHRVIREGRVYHVNALWERGIDPMQRFQGDSALLCAVKTNPQMITTLLDLKKTGETEPAILVDQVDAKGKHVLSHVAESSRNSLDFTKLLVRFIEQTEAKEEGGSLAVRRQAVLLPVIQQLLENKQRQIPTQMKKLLKVFAYVDVSQLKTDAISAEPNDAVHHLLHVIRATKAKDWSAAMDHYCFYCWHMELSVDDEISPEFSKMLQHQGCAEFITQLTTQRANPTGLLQMKALLQQGAPALTQFLAWTAKTEPHSSTPRPLLPSLRMLKHLCFPPGFKQEDPASPLTRNFSALCAALIADVNDHPDSPKQTILALMAEVNTEAAAECFMQHFISPQKEIEDFPMLDFDSTPTSSAEKSHAGKRKREKEEEKDEGGEERDEKGEKKEKEPEVSDSQQSLLQKKRKTEKPKKKKNKKEQEPSTAAPSPSPTPEADHGQQQKRKRKREQEQEQEEENAEGEMDVDHEQKQEGEKKEEKEVGFHAKRTRNLVRNDEENEAKGFYIFNDTETLLSSLRSLKTVFAEEVYQDFLYHVVKQLGPRLPKDIHHYPELFTYILQEITDLHIPLFIHSSDFGIGCPPIYYTPLGYTIKAQLDVQLQDYIMRDQRGEEVGMHVAADSLRRTPMMLVVRFTRFPKESQPVVTEPALFLSMTSTSSTATEQKREGKHEAITFEERQQREEKERTIVDWRARESKGESKEREIKVKEKDEPAVAMSDMVISTQLSISSSSGTPRKTISPTLLATDLNGNHVLHHAMQGTLEMFIVIARRIQQQISPEQWHTLVRQTNHAGDTILSLAAAQGDIAKVLEFLSMDGIEVVTLDLSPCRSLPLVHYLAPLLQEIKERKDLSDNEARHQWNQFEFKTFGSLWQLFQQERTHITSVLYRQFLQVPPITSTLFTQFLQVIVNVWEHYKGEAYTIYCGSFYFKNIVTKQMKQIPKHHPAQPLLALFRLCTKLGTDNFGDGSELVNPALFALREEEEGITRQLIQDELAAPPDSHRVILRNIMISGTFAQFTTAVAMYLEYGGIEALNETEILAQTCIVPRKANHALHLMTIEGISIAEVHGYHWEEDNGDTIFEEILSAIETDKETLDSAEADDVSIEDLETLRDYRTIRNTLLTNKEVQRYQYQKYKTRITSGDISKKQERVAAVLSLPHLIASGLNFRGELEIWLSLQDDGYTAIEHLLDIEENKDDPDSASVLLQAFASEFKNLTAQLHLPQSASGYAGPGVIRRSPPPPVPDLKAIKALATRVAIEITKYYETRRPDFRAAATSLRTYLETDLTRPEELDPAVWQVPELTQLLTALGVSQPAPAVASVMK